MKYDRRFHLQKVLPGSTLVEALVASIIFLVVFAVSLETTVRITAAGAGSGYKYVQVLAAVEQAKREYTSGRYSEGNYEDEYEWGTTQAAVTRYDGYENIYRLNIRVRIKNDIKRLEYDFLFEKGL